MGRKMKESTKRIIKLLEETNLTYDQIAEKVIGEFKEKEGNFTCTKQNISYIMKKYKPVRPKIPKNEEDEGTKELKAISGLMKKEIDESKIIQQEIENREKSRPLKVICPICNKKKIIVLTPELVKTIKTEKKITRISVNKKIKGICEHVFIVHVDWNFEIRGYDKNENFEIKTDRISNIQNGLTELRNLNKSKQKEQEKEEVLLTDEEIYNEFWEFIDDDNPEFKEFIIKDKKRRELRLKKQREKEKKENIENRSQKREEIDAKYDREKIRQEYYRNKLQKFVLELYKKQEGIS